VQIGADIGESREHDCRFQKYAEHDDACPGTAEHSGIVGRETARFCFRLRRNAYHRIAQQLEHQQRDCERE
jgi:hypothetical protein